MPEPNQCIVCDDGCFPPAPLCNYCAKPVCYQCRTAGKHIHKGNRFLIGFCFPCGKIQPLRRRHDGPHCTVCDVGWSSRAAIGMGENADVMICPFCAARQQKPLLPAPCARCAMMLV